MLPIGALKILTAFREARQWQHTGEVVLRSGDATGRVFFAGGKIAWATASTIKRNFTNYMVEEAKLEEEALKQVFEECKRTGKNFGETIVEWGLLDEPTLRKFLLEQIADSVLEVFAWPTPESMFVPGRRAYRGSLTFDVAEVLQRVIEADREGRLPFRASSAEELLQEGERASAEAAQAAPAAQGGQAGQPAPVRGKGLWVAVAAAVIVAALGVTGSGFFLRQRTSASGSAAGGDPTAVTIAPALKPTPLGSADGSAAAQSAALRNSPDTGGAMNAAAGNPSDSGANGGGGGSAGGGGATADGGTSEPAGAGDGGHAPDGGMTGELAGTVDGGGIEGAPADAGTRKAPATPTVADERPRAFPPGNLVAYADGEGQGTIRVKSTPAKAAIFLDGVSTGLVTPAVLVRIPAGRDHVVLVDKEGLLPAFDRLTLKKNETAEVKLSPSKRGKPWAGRTAIVRIESSPPGASVVLDGSPFKQLTPVAIPVPTGKTSMLVVIHDGYAPWVRNVRAVPELQLTFFARLKKQ